MEPCPVWVLSAEEGTPGWASNEESCVPIPRVSSWVGVTTTVLPLLQPRAWPGWGRSPCRARPRASALGTGQAQLHVHAHTTHTRTHTHSRTLSVELCPGDRLMGCLVSLLIPPSVSSAGNRPHPQCPPLSSLGITEVPAPHWLLGAPVGGLSQDPSKLGWEGGERPP